MESTLRAVASHKLFAAVIGIVLAAVPVYWFTSWLEEQGEAEASVAATGAVRLIDLTLDGVVAKLAELAGRGIDSCTPAVVETLRQTVFGAGPIKQLSLVEPSGGVSCTDAGTSSAPPDVLASAATSNRSVMLDVVRLAGHDDNLLRVRYLAPQRKPALAALIPVDLLLPRLAPGGALLSGYASMMLADGTLVGKSGQEPAQAAQEAYVTGRARSERYGPIATVNMQRRGIVASYEDLRRIGIVVSGLFAVTILLCAIFIPRRQRHNPVAEIEAALVADQFIPYYQPIIDLKTGKLCGAEVLVRWRRPDGTIIAPGTFIPLVESKGLILDLTRSLMRQVCQELGAIMSQRPGMYITFNIAPRHFTDSAILNDVGAIFEGSPIKLSQIVLEITERFEIENLTATRRVITALQALGCRVALDDVGTGHSGLSYILKLGVDIIKIDRLFVEAIKTEHHAQAIVQTLVDLARNLRMQIVAEGVERIEQVEYLRDHGISAAQGYLFTPPLPGPSFIKLARAIAPLPSGGGAKEVAPAPDGVAATKEKLAAA